MEEMAATRRTATTAAGKQIPKQVMKNIYGRFYMNKEKQRTVQVKTDAWGFYRRVAQISTKDFNVLDPEVFLGLLYPPRKDFVYDTPRPAAWAILDLSRMYTWRWYYECLKKHWNGCRLCYHDTDSFIAALKTEDFIKAAQVWNKSPRAGVVGAFDLSSTGVECPNKGMLGCFKNELKTLEATEGCFLASKTYAVAIKEYVRPEGKEHEDHVKAKGIPTAIVSKYRFELFREMMFNPSKHTVKFCALRVKQATSIKVKIAKKGLSFQNDKVFMWTKEPQDSDEPIMTRPHGHWRNTEDSDESP